MPPRKMPKSWILHHIKLETGMPKCDIDKILRALKGIVTSEISTKGVCMIPGIAKLTVKQRLRRSCSRQ